MSTDPHHEALVAMQVEAEVEIEAAELLHRAADSQEDPTGSLTTLELGYYEAELRSLRGAAATLDRAPAAHELP